MKTHRGEGSPQHILQNDVQGRHVPPLEVHGEVLQGAAVGHTQSGVLWYDLALDVCPPGYGWVRHHRGCTARDGQGCHLLQARLDGLGPPYHAVLQHAQVRGVHGVGASGDHVCRVCLGRGGMDTEKWYTATGVHEKVGM